MSDLIIPILAIVAVADVIIGLIVFSRGIKSLPDVIFECIIFTLIIWSIAIIGFYSSVYQYSIGWVLITHSSAILISYFFLIFTLNFPRKIKSSRKVIFYATIILLSLFYLIFFTEEIIGSSNGISYKLGEYYLYYSLVLILYFMIGFICLIKQYKANTNVTQQNQIKYLLIGYLISSSLAIIPDLILPYFGVFQYTWMGPLFAFILITTLFIAIFKYQLFQVKIILTEIISIVIIIALLLELFFTRSIAELLLKTAVLIIVTIFSFLLIRGVYREITQREKIELLATDLKKANTRLLELDKQKSEFISFASHQLRAPLTAMKGYASLILDGDLGELNKEVKDAITRIFDSSKTLVNIVNDYLNISRIELGTMKYSFIVINLKEYIKNIIEELKPNFEKSNLAFDFITNPISENERFMVSADPDKLKQVISNLIDNSIKYTPKGTIHISLTKDIEERKITFSVKDSGVGISEDVMPKLFSKFMRSNKANEQNIYGTGLGLYIAKEIVIAHKGKIWAESEGEGKGSTFLVELEMIV